MRWVASMGPIRNVALEESLRRIRESLVPASVEQFQTARAGTPREGGTVMLDTTDTPLQSLLRRRKPGYSLEAPFYTSPEVFKADLDIIFHRHWIFVGVEPDVPEPGDAMSFDIGGTSVFVVRDDDMGLRAFHNVSPPPRRAADP